MDREQIIQRASELLERDWQIVNKHELFVEELTDFAIEVRDETLTRAVKAERKRIAGQLYEAWIQSGTDLDYRHKVAELAKKLLEAE